MTARRFATGVIPVIIAALAGRLTGFGWAGDDPPSPALAAVEDAVQQAIARAEPSIACIIVSRSDNYQKCPWLSDGIRSAEPGQLGGYRPPGDDEASILNLFEDVQLRRLKPEVRRLNLADPSTPPESYGSGVVIAAGQGPKPGLLVLTNYHVVRDATKVFVRLPPLPGQDDDRGSDRGSYADIHAADPRSDLAVLRLLDPAVKAPVIPLNNGPPARKGQFVLSLANPFAAGFRDGSPSASWGIISNLRRRPHQEINSELAAFRSLSQTGVLLQTDARLNLGCSGGALLNLRGEVIGLTTATAAVTGSETSGGFAMPVDAIMRRVIDTLTQGKEVEYGFLGVKLGPIDPPRAGRGEDGVQISDVIHGAPAQQAGLQMRDVIRAVDGVRIRETDDLFLYVGTALAGRRVTVDYTEHLSGLRRRTVITLAKSPGGGPIIASNRPSFRGLRVDYTSVLAFAGQQHAVLPAGVVITQIAKGSPADRAGLKYNEVITRVNDQPVASPAEFYDLATKSPGRIELTISGADQFRPPTKVKLDQ